MSYLTRETVRRWLAPIGAVVLFVLAFLENPTVAFMRILLPPSTKAERKLDSADAAVIAAKQEAAAARDLMRVVAKRWDGRRPGTLADLAALSASPRDFDALAAGYDLDATLWPAKSKMPPASIVLRGRGEQKRLILAGPDAVTVIDPKFVIAEEGYR